MVRGRKITLHLVEGTPNGIIKAQIGNWSGKITVSNINPLYNLASDEDVTNPGTYILSGRDPEAYEREAIYIGEGENVWDRLKQHESDETKIDFERVAIITSTDSSLTKGHIRYLEARLIQTARQAGQARITNKTNPDLSPLPASDRDEMEVFLDHIKLILPVLQLTYLQPPPQIPAATSEPIIQSAVEAPLFHLINKSQETGITVEARAQFIDNRFVVFEGSTALLRIEGGYKILKEELIQNGKLRHEGNLYRFTENVPFESVSAAAAIVRGQNTNGRVYWKIENGQTYRDWAVELLSAKEK